MNPDVPPASQTIILIDDEVEILEILTEMFAGYQVVSFLNGEEALAWLPAHLEENITLAICDYVIPGPDGVATLQRIRDIAPQIKLVLMSGKAVEELDALVDANNFARALVKPFTMGQVRALINQMLAPS